MTNHVTDTNVGKMTIEEAIKGLMSIVTEIDDWRCNLGQVPNEKEMNQLNSIYIAIEALQFQQNIVKCKNCMDSDSAGQYCYNWRQETEENGYCHLGERRKINV